MNSRAIQHMLRHPSALMHFQATGRMPRGVEPDSPLIRLLESLNPRERVAITGLSVGPQLGYTGNHRFDSAEQALRWLKPSPEMFGSWPAEIWRDKHFLRPISLAELAVCAERVPESVQRRLDAHERPAPGEVQGASPGAPAAADDVTEESRDPGRDRERG